MSAPLPRTTPKAPELGAFPLDHFRECKSQIEDYYRCLGRNNNIAPKCRDETKAYLQCRMDRGLMDKADVEAFGIPSDTEFVPSTMHKKDMRSYLNKNKLEQVNPVLTQVLRDHAEVEDGFERPKGSGPK